MSLKADYLDAKKNYDNIIENVTILVKRELEIQKLDINDPSNDEKIIAIEIEIEKQLGLYEASKKLRIAEEKLLSCACDKVKDLFRKGIINEDFSYLFESKILRIRNEAIELALKLTDT
jgi:hypothetical protein